MSNLDHSDAENHRSNIVTRYENLTPAQEIFASEYAASLNGTAAYRVAYPQSKQNAKRQSEHARRLRRLPKIAKRIAELQFASGAVAPSQSVGMTTAMLEGGVATGGGSVPSLFEDGDRQDRSAVNVHELEICARIALNCAVPDALRLTAVRELAKQLNSLAGPQPVSVGFTISLVTASDGRSTKLA